MKINPNEMKIDKLYRGKLGNKYIYFSKRKDGVIEFYRNKRDYKSSEIKEDEKHGTQ